MKFSASKRPRKGRPAAVYCIDGENVTLEQIAARLGVNRKKASARLSHVKQFAPAVTWKVLGESK